MLINVRRSDENYVSVILLEHPKYEYYIIINQVIPDIVTMIICILGHIIPCLMLIFCLIILNIDPWTPLIKIMQGQGHVPPGAMIKNTMAYLLPYQFMTYLLIFYIIIYFIVKIYTRYKKYKMK